MHADAHFCRNTDGGRALNASASGLQKEKLTDRSVTAAREDMLWPYVVCACYDVGVLQVDRAVAFERREEDISVSFEEGTLCGFDGEGRCCLVYEELGEQRV